jgi:hypothetical protein
MLVPQPLVKDNYGTWRQSMTMALTAKNKIRLIDGSIKEPNKKNPKNVNNGIAVIIWSKLGC